MERRDFTPVGIGAGLVLGPALIAYSIAGLVHDRDYYKAQAALPRPTKTVTAGTATPPIIQPSPAPSVLPSGPSPTASPSPSPRVLQAAASNPAATSPPADSRPAARPSATRTVTASPTPGPTSPASRCPAASLLTLRLPLTVLPCNAVIAGGSS